MSLLDLVEEDDRIRATADLLRQLTGLVVADVAGRGTDETRHRVAFAELAHIESDHGRFVVEQGLRQSLRQLRLSDAGGAEEEEAADGTVGIGHTGLAATDGAGDGGHGFVLSDHPVVEDLFHVRQTCLLALRHPLRRDSGGAGDHMRDLLLADDRLGGSGLHGLRVRVLG